MVLRDQVWRAGMYGMARDPLFARAVPTALEQYGAGFDDEPPSRTSIDA